jgi:hypothetical protein
VLLFQSSNSDRKTATRQYSQLHSHGVADRVPERVFCVPLSKASSSEGGPSRVWPPSWPFHSSHTLGISSPPHEHVTTQTRPTSTAIRSRQCLADSVCRRLADKRNSRRRGPSGLHAANQHFGEQSRMGCHTHVARR